MTAVKSLCHWPLLLSTILTTLFTSYSVAQTPSDQGYVEQLQQQAINKSLYQNSYWLALGHYHSGDSQQQHFDSYTNDPAFFLSAEGATTPKDELLATIKAFFNTEITGDEHAQCRFPARLNWLSQQLSIDPQQLPQATCAQYAKWRSTINAESVTLIFASHYVNSPSSMYGHTLLRIDPPQSAQSSDWLSYAVNFGANITSDDNNLLYAWRGLTGGYPGTFAIEPYYKKIKVYSNMENRGLWEYKLNFKPDEVERLMTHLWELNKIDFDYMFFNQNCSFRLLELFEIAQPGIDLLSPFSIKAVPTDTVRAVKNEQLISESHYRTASIEKLKNTIKELNPEQQNLAYQLTHDTRLLESIEYQNTIGDKEPQILYLAYNYLRYLQRKVARDTNMAERSHRLLIAISQTSTRYKPEQPKPFDPIMGHKTNMLGLGIGSEGDNEYTEVQLRTSYHDLLDPAAGYPLGLGIEMFGLKVRQWRGGNTTIEKIDIVSIDALTVRDQFFKEYSWRINTGFERFYNEEGSQLAPNVNAAGGVTYALNDNIYSYALASVRYEYNESFSDDHQVGAGATFGLLSRYGLLNSSIELNGYELSNGVERTDSALKLNYSFTANQSLRFEIKHTKESRYSDDVVNLSYRLFY